MTRRRALILALLVAIAFGYGALVVARRPATRGERVDALAGRISLGDPGALRELVDSLRALAPFTAEEARGLAGALSMRGTRREDAEVEIDDVVAEIAEADATAIARLLSLERFRTLAFHALLGAGRPDLACPEPIEAVLLARSRHRDYEKACASFEWGGRVSTDISGNDWDVLFGNGPDGFDVNTVTDDRSGIADVGSVALDEAVLPPPHDPRWVNLATRNAPSNPRWYVDAVVGHTYIVHTVDTETDLVAVFRVLELVPGDHVRIAFRVLEARRIERR